MTRNPFVKLFAIGFAIAVLVALSYGNLSSDQSSSAASCNVETGVCQTASGIGLSFSGPIAVNKPLMLTLTLPESAQHSLDYLSATLTGRDMYMGITQTKLMAQQGGKFVGELRIPICTTEKMDWQLAISVPNEDVAPLIYQFSITHK